MSRIDVLLDKNLLDIGIEHYYELPLQAASYLVFGPSGSGKSVLTKCIVGRIGLYLPDVKVSICDGKADDYTFLRGIAGARHYEFLGIREGLADYYTDFESRLNGSPDRSYRLMVLEEWGSFYRSMEVTDKKAAQTSLSQLFSITSMGRSYNIHALLSVQRPDASLLSGFRENFTVVCGLGRISPEAARMVGFNEYPAFDNEKSGKGVGWYLTDEGLKQVQVPIVKNWDKLHNAIKIAVTR